MSRGKITRKMNSFPGGARIAERLGLIHGKLLEFLSADTLSATQKHEKQPSYYSGEWHEINPDHSHELNYRQHLGGHCAIAFLPEINYYDVLAEKLKWRGDGLQSPSMAMP